MPTPFDVFVVTPERRVWGGRATIVVARGSEGEFAIMNGHAPLLVELGIGPLFIQTENERVAAAVHGGFLHCLTEGDETRVDILAEIAELESEIDADRARRAREEAERRLGEAHDAEAETDLAKALVRLNVRG